MNKSIFFEDGESLPPAQYCLYGPDGVLTVCSSDVAVINQNLPEPNEVDLVPVMSVAFTLVVAATALLVRARKNRREASTNQLAPIEII